MTGISFLQRDGFLRIAAATLITVCLAGIFAVQPAVAATERALYLYYTHTKETARIVFKRDGKYVQSGLNELNQFLRDWRRNEPTKMDPRLFDLVWEVYQEVGGSQPINVVSAYRSPKTNAMLAQTSSGVADNSQHMRGTAMDFFIPGVPLAKLRATAMRKQVGGVGYYPTSGSPFVHLDVGSVRAWPRMTRAQLKELFPDGRTMHLPTDGKPLSQEGYQLALAEWKQCHAYPCNGSSSGTMVADSGGGNGKTLMDVLFGGKPGNNAAPTPAAAAPAPVQVAAAQPPAAALQPTAPEVAPMPAPRPAELMVAAVEPSQAAAAPVPATPAFMPFSTVGSAPLDPSEMTTAEAPPIPAMKSETLRLATASALPAGDAVTALAALTEPPVPMPPLHQPATTLTAYAPANEASSPSGLGRPIIASLGPTVTGSIQPGRPVVASVGTPIPSDLTALPPSPTQMASLFSGTFSAAQGAQATDLAAALTNHVTKPAAAEGMRKPDLVAPDFEHVTDIFAAPASLSSNHFAVIFDRDQADFDPTPEMGPHVIVMGAGDDTTMGNTRFAPVTN